MSGAHQLPRGDTPQGTLSDSPKSASEASTLPTSQTTPPELRHPYLAHAARILGTSLVFYHGDRAHFLDLVTRVSDALVIHRDDAGDLVHQLINDEHDHRLDTIQSVYTRIDLSPKLMQAYGLCSPTRAYERADRRAAEKRKAVAS